MIKVPVPQPVAKPIPKQSAEIKKQPSIAKDPSPFGGNGNDDLNTLIEEQQSVQSSFEFKKYEFQHMSHD
jgi:hypothetical protein